MVMVRVEHVMGMPVVADVRDEVDGRTLDELFDELRWVDEVFSTYKPDSEVSRLTRGELALASASPEVAGVLELCEQLRLETSGYFDARAGGALDPSGYVKGWAVERAAAVLDAAGARNYALSAGGDVVVRGGALPADRWPVGIQHPLLRDRLAAVVEVTDLAVATSGSYERGEHILDPHTGRPPEGVLSVTLVGPSLAAADAYATAAFAMGPVRGPSWTAQLLGYETMTILADERVLTTPGFPGDGETWPAAAA
jgi:thiamine biosynthesis lipoprotein